MAPSGAFFVMKDPRVDQTQEFFRDVVRKRADYYQFIQYQIGRLMLKHEDVYLNSDAINSWQWLWLHREMARKFMVYVKSQGGKDVFIQDVLHWCYVSNIESKLKEIWGDDFDTAHKLYAVRLVLRKMATTAERILLELYWNSKYLLDSLDKLENEDPFWANLDAKQEEFLPYIKRMDTAIALCNVETLVDSPDFAIGGMIDYYRHYENH